MSVKRLDGRSVVALAHPLRMRIVGTLRQEGPATATLLGKRLGESSGLTSYHVRVLAEHGFVEEATELGSGRERWWKASHDMTSWRPGDFRDDPEERHAEQWVTGFAAQRGMEELDGWLRRRPEAEPEWAVADEVSDYFLDLTPTELRAVADEIRDVILRHREERRGAEADPLRTRVRMLVYGFPAAEAEADDG
jgi:DNA-binding transcriptional ArsR family regulator